MRDDTIPGLAEQGVALDLLLSLLRAIQAQDIACCYWKSRRRIRAALAGDSDLDLLVARHDQHRLHAVLLACGFKPFPSVGGWGHPAIASLLGLDTASGRLVHVHLHQQLAVGSSLIKQYRLPWEDALLAGAEFDPALPIRVLSPEAEFLLLLVRCCLELRAFDPLLVGRRKQACEKHCADRAAVLPYVDETALDALSTQLLGDDVAPRVVALARAGGERDPDRRLQRELRRRLAPWRSCNAAESAFWGCGRTLLWTAARVNRAVQAPRPTRRRAPGGGIVVAVVGVDGSGKSTLVRSLRSWLGAETSVMPLYFGTGDGRPSLLLLPFKLAARTVRPIFRSKPRTSSHGRVTERPPGLLYSLMLTLWAGVLAVEKRRKLLAARRAASRGMVVVADRYPQNQIVGYNDGPLLPRVALAPSWLRRFEAEAYALAARMPPDLVIKLDAAPALIRMREPDMNPRLIERRTTDLRRLAFAGARIVSIDASRPLVEVIQAAKSAVWDLL